nr:plakophilin-2-like isoform X2 [Paramormyrops kingsleyae]
MSDTRSFKSAQISARRPETLDTSLALPAEENMAVLHEKAPDRNARVQEQVRLTLARKKKDAISNGNIYSQDSTFDSGKGLQYSVMAQSPSHLGSVGMYSLKRLTRSGEMSPKSSPLLSYGTLFGSQNSGTGCQGAYTLPAARSFKHHTRSEMPLSQRVQAPPQTNQNKGSLHRSYRKQRSLLGQQQAGSLSLLTAGRGKGMDQGNRQHSCSASFASVELDSRVGQAGSMKAAALLGNQNGRQQAGSLSLLTAGRGKGRDQGNKQDSCTTSFASVDSWVGQTCNMKPAAQLENQNGRQQAGNLSLLTAGRSKGMDQGNKQETCTTSFASVDVDSRVGQTGSMKAAAQLGNQNGVCVMKGRKSQSALTLERAVNQLSHTDTDLQVSAAYFIQHQCFISRWCKNKLLLLGGIPKLLKVLQSDNEELQKAGISALRNAVYEDSKNKEEVRDQNGIRTLVSLLHSNRDIETRVQLTGLLWNLSSHDCLKDQISKEGLKILTESIIVPCSGISEGENPKNDLLVHPEIFYNATGCLRNLSSAGPLTRTELRDCDSLIDALVHFVQTTIADHNADDKSTENCVCILHNLSYQMDAEKSESPPAPQQDPAPLIKVPGCFGSRSKEIAQATPLPLSDEKKEETNPQGKQWLSSSNAVRMYLSLVARSSRKCTLEAATGALLNATIGIGTMQQNMAQTIVKTEKGLENLKKLLFNPEHSVRRVALSLLNNISHYQVLHDELVKQVLPDLISMLPSPGSSAEVPMEITVLLCRILTNLSLYNSEHVRAISNHGGLAKIMDISSVKNGMSPSKASDAASALLQAMWEHKDLRLSFINAGYKKADFINGGTKKAISLPWNAEKTKMDKRLPKKAEQMPPSGNGERSN